MILSLLIIIIPIILFYTVDNINTIVFYFISAMYIVFVSCSLFYVYEETRPKWRYIGDDRIKYIEYKTDDFMKMQITGQDLTMYSKSDIDHSFDGSYTSSFSLFLKADSILYEFIGTGMHKSKGICIRDKEFKNIIKTILNSKSDNMKIYYHTRHTGYRCTLEHTDTIEFTKEDFIKNLDKLNISELD